MKTTFVNKRSELTAAKEANEARGFDVYRTRMACRCAAPHNRRNAIIVIDLTGHILEYVIRCRGCVQSINPSIS